MAYEPKKPARRYEEPEIRLPWWVWAYFLIGMAGGFFLGWLEGGRR